MTRRRRGDPVGIRDLQAVGDLGATELAAMSDHGRTAELRGAARKIALARERATADALRAYLRETDEIRVSFRRPAWLPEWAYRRLLRSIAIETRAKPTAGLARRSFGRQWDKAGPSDPANRIAKRSER
jgi:hypothetical protein